MRRDLDLCRQILLLLEETPNCTNETEFRIAGVEPEVVSYHVKLLSDAGLIEAIDASDFGGLKWIPLRLTWSGHEFIDATRSDTIWRKAKDKAQSVTGSLGFEAIKAALQHLVESAMK